jgi:acylpyruvate hydrolase
VGQNYAAHAAETGAKLPAFPNLFAKFASTLLGANDDLGLPAASSEVDWEVELAFVIGGRGRNLSPDEARATIAGYTVANDVSMRDWQNRTSQFLPGKAFEATTPIGPVLVTPDELPEGSADNLRLVCEVDGVTVQDSRTSDMIFGVGALASYLSTILSLAPGMLVLTGTPSGVGAGRKPPVFLRDGQLMRTTIEGIGTLENRCVAEKP